MGMVAIHRSLIIDSSPRAAPKRTISVSKPDRLSLEEKYKTLFFTT